MKQSFGAQNFLRKITSARGWQEAKVRVSDVQEFFEHKGKRPAPRSKFALAWRRVDSFGSVNTTLCRITEIPVP